MDGIVSGMNGPEFDMNLLKPILDGVDGFYQIGPSEKCAEKFVLSVTVAFAANLLQVWCISSFCITPNRRPGSCGVNLGHSKSCQLQYPIVILTRGGPC